MAFKYYLRGPDDWTELSDRMQHLLARFDALALSFNQGAMVGIQFPIPNLRHGLGRSAKFEVRCVSDQLVHFRTMRFEDGERTEVVYAERAPDVLDTDWYYPAPLAV